MEHPFESAKWIWKRDALAIDDYAQFTAAFSVSGKEPVTLHISADSSCNVYLNGQLVFFKQFADYPFYKLCDSVDITRYCRAENDLRICVWYFGRGNSSYYPDAPGLLFAVHQGQKTLAASSESTQSRTDTRYRSGMGKIITGQLGFSYFYDNTAKPLPWEGSVAAEKTTHLRCNPLKPLALLPRTPFHILRQDERCALIDLGREEAGFLQLRAVSPEEQTVTVTFGEHIADGGVRRLIGDRDFSVQLRLAPGQNHCSCTLRRLAGRYLEIFYDHPLNIEYLGLLPVHYPVQTKPFTAASPLRRQIYDTAVRTLQLSMHEHYEDCPWREQAMYVLDSRNQMLCGYYCFDNAPYARQNLLLMAQGQRSDGMLELTYPAKDTPAIPFFSLMYPVTVAEYVAHTGDGTVVPLVLPAIRRILDAVSARKVNSLIPDFPSPYWNFYEWSDGSDNLWTLDIPYEKQFDLILNCAYVMALESTARLTGEQVDLTALRARIHETFYDEKAGLYFAGTEQRRLYTQLGNSLAILAGVAQGKELAEKLRQDGPVKATLSMRGFFYDALLRADPQNRDFVLRDIESIYGNMLAQGATSFWETEKGEADFDGAGSLCHGWSAIPIYYFHLLQ